MISGVYLGRITGLDIGLAALARCGCAGPEAASKAAGDGGGKRARTLAAGAEGGTQMETQRPLYMTATTGEGHGRRSRAHPKGAIEPYHLAVDHPVLDNCLDQVPELLGLPAAAARGRVGWWLSVGGIRSGGGGRQLGWRPRAHAPEALRVGHRRCQLVLDLLRQAREELCSK